MQSKFTRLYGQQSGQPEAGYLSEPAMDQTEGRKIDLMNALRWEDDGSRLVLAIPAETAQPTFDDQYQ